MATEQTLSVVIPCHNEEANLPALFTALRETLPSLGRSYEIIVTDDASNDGSWRILADTAQRDPAVRVQRLASQSGESAASWAGIRAARGRFIATMDADLQNDPRDLPKFLEALREADCVCGVRTAERGRTDGWTRSFSSRTANAVRRVLLDDGISDSGCTYRVFKRECIANLKFFNGMHRFLPALIRLEGFTVTEIAVTNHPRGGGCSHYGIGNRLWASLYDLFAVRWMKRRMFSSVVAEKLN